MSKEPGVDDSKSDDLDGTKGGDTCDESNSPVSKIERHCENRPTELHMKTSDLESTVRTFA